MLVPMIEIRAYSHDGCALLDGDDVILGGTHRQLPKAVLAGEIAQRAEPAAATVRVGGERRHRHQARHRHWRALDERAQLLRCDAGLAVIAGDVDLYEDAHSWVSDLAVALELAQRGLGGDGVDEAHVGDDQAYAPALQLPDEIPLEQFAVRRHLLREILRAVLPH